MQIRNSVVLITGASQGIGAACSRVFDERGARLSIVARDAQKLASVGGPNALRTAGDITRDEVRRNVVARTIERFGGIDILINNAGMGLYSAAWNAPMEDARTLFELNLFAPLALTQLVVAGMRERQRGAIVNISSIAGKMTLPWFTLYSVSKFALGSLTDGLRMELKPYGIHAMTVWPGYVKTDFQAHALGTRPPDAVRKGKRFAVTAGACAEAIARGLERDARNVVVPRIGWVLVALTRLLPALVESRLAAINQTRASA
ncbi:MAG: SDR family NAD(P)-dependent oxidoreductase [Acidobacteriia bacterium]|nr:SDR family NAD(P)-dependent oxidoreductase [Terriglobia bacterium]